MVNLVVEAPTDSASINTFLPSANTPLTSAVEAVEKVLKGYNIAILFC